MIKTMIAVVAFIAFFYFYARYLERTSLYYPSKQIEATPKDINLKYEDIYFSSEDNIELHGWFIPSEGAKLSMIFVHGNGGNISHRLEKLHIFNELGVNTFIFDYRGYGQSRGKPQEEGLYKDAVAAYNYIMERQKQSKIIVYGESLGGAVAIDLASRVDIEGLVLEGTFTSVKDMAKVIYPWLPGFLLRTKFNSVDKIAKINAPKLHFHGQWDDIVPISLGKKLFEAAQSPKKFIAIDGAHNDAFFVSEEKVRKELKTFFRNIGG